MLCTTPVIDVSSLGTVLTTAVAPADILLVVGVCVGAGIGFVLTWFGARKLIAVFQTALKNGKIKI